MFKLELIKQSTQVKEYLAFFLCKIKVWLLIYGTSDVGWVSSVCCCYRGNCG